MTIQLLPSECWLTLREVCRYVGRSPQQVATHRRKGWINAKDRRVKLDDFCRYLAHVYPACPRLESVEELNQWRANGSHSLQ
jgi:hypothetical protein